jgi:hypothetical protein
LRVKKAAPHNFGKLLLLQLFESERIENEAVANTPCSCDTGGVLLLRDANVSGNCTVILVCLTAPDFSFQRVHLSFSEKVCHVPTIQSHSAPSSEIFKFTYSVEI